MSNMEELWQQVSSGVPETYFFEFHDGSQLLLENVVRSWGRVSGRGDLGFETADGHTHSIAEGSWRRFEMHNLGGPYEVDPETWTSRPTGAIKRTVVISEPGAAIRVERLELTDEAKAALTTGVSCLPGVLSEPRPGLWSRLKRWLKKD